VVVVVIFRVAVVAPPGRRKRDLLIDEDASLEARQSNQSRLTLILPRLSAPLVPAASRGDRERHFGRVVVVIFRVAVVAPPGRRKRDLLIDEDASLEARDGHPADGVYEFVLPGPPHGQLLPSLATADGQSDGGEVFESPSSRLPEDENGIS
jgi:hypothetical protein